MYREFLGEQEVNASTIGGLCVAYSEDAQNFDGVCLKCSIDEAVQLAKNLRCYDMAEEESTAKHLQRATNFLSRFVAETF